MPRVMCQSRALAYRFEPHGQVRDKAVTRFSTRIRRCDGWLHEVAEIKPKPFRERWRSCRSRRLHDLRRCTFTERVTRRGTTCYERERERAAIQKLLSKRQMICAVCKKVWRMNATGTG